MTRSRLALEHARLDTPDDPRLDALRAEDAAFLDAFPTPEALARATRRPRAPMAAGIGAIAIAAALAIAPSVLRGPEVRAKGANAVRLLVKRGDRADPFTGGALGAGDTLAFRYSTPHPYMLVMGLSTAGAESWVAEDGHSVRIEPGEDLTAPLGVRLDDAPEPERVLVLLSEIPLDVADVARRLEGGLDRADDAARARLDPGPLDLPAHVTSWHLEKRTR